MTNRQIFLTAVAVMALAAGCQKLPNDGGKKKESVPSGTVIQSSMLSVKRARTAGCLVDVLCQYGGSHESNVARS